MVDLSNVRLLQILLGMDALHPQLLGAFIRCACTRACGSRLSLWPPSPLWASSPASSATSLWHGTTDAKLIKKINQLL
jgi:hypothetical protein